MVKMNRLYETTTLNSNYKSNNENMEKLFCQGIFDKKE